MNKNSLKVLVLATLGFSVLAAVGFNPAVFNILAIGTCAIALAEAHRA